jgi:DNA polymerase
MLTALQRVWLREIGIEKVWLAPSQADRPAAGNPPAEILASAAISAPATIPTPTTTPTSATTPTLAPVAQPSDAEPRPIDYLDVQTPSTVALEIEALRAEVSACTACGLCKGRKQAVLGDGALQAPWLVVGEAPGEEEDRQGIPFVGRSGQLLNAMLAAVDKQRAHHVFITNVIKCRPPGNRNPRPEEIAHCRPFLMRQIALLKPTRILVLGRFAAQTLLQTDATIGSLRGRVHQFKTETGEIPLVASYHPAYLLRSPTEKARTWQDLMLIARL